MPLRVHPHPTFTTRNTAGDPNGWLVPIYNLHDGFVAPENQPHQVYLTVCDVGEIKGPHLHLKRWGFFTCIRGNIRVVARTDQGYEHHFSGQDYQFATIEVPAGVPSALQNIGDEPAYIINTPSPAWRADDRDEHEVTFDDAALKWPE